MSYRALRALTFAAIFYARAFTRSAGRGSVVGARATSRALHRSFVTTRRITFFILLPVAIKIALTLSHWLDVAICATFEVLVFLGSHVYRALAHASAVAWQHLRPHYERHLAPHVAFVRTQLSGEQKWIHAAAIGGPSLMAGAGLSFLALSVAGFIVPGFALTRGDDTSLLAWILSEPVLFLLALPITAEIVFRVYLVRYFSLALSARAAVLVSAALYGFVTLDPVYGTVFAVAMSAIHRRTRTILVPVVLHIAHNVAILSFAGLFKTVPAAPLFSAVELRDPFAIAIFIAMTAVGSPGLYWAALALRTQDGDEDGEPGDARRVVLPVTRAVSSERLLEG